MNHDPAACYTAYASRDPRFDGVFYVGVTSTGIYCRPVCTARTPKAANCRFFASAAMAEKAAFRPCLRCRPELAPGNAPVDDAQRIASVLAERIEHGMLDDDAGLEAVAAQFGLSSRHMRRIVQQELGVSPIELLQTRRLLLAKQLLTETTLPMIEVAFASGFRSVRRFNAVWHSRYGMPPSRLRTRDGVAQLRSANDTLTLRLHYRPPYDWPGVLDRLRAGALPHVEHVDEAAYRRTIRLADRAGWLHVRHLPEQRAVLAEWSHALVPVLPALLGQVRHMFDLSARPDVIAAHLAHDPLLADAVAANPGMRVPGAFDGFEAAVRAVLNQRRTSAAAAALAERFVAAWGEPIATPHAELTHHAPTPQRIAALGTKELAAIGISPRHARSIIALAEAVATGQLDLYAGAPPEATIAQLVSLPGISMALAHVIAMRALRWPDAFPNDRAIQQRLGGVSAARAEALSQAWRPWRSYAAMHLWHSANDA